MKSCTHFHWIARFWTRTMAYSTTQEERGRMWTSTCNRATAAEPRTFAGLRQRDSRTHGLSHRTKKVPKNTSLHPCRVRLHCTSRPPTSTTARCKPLEYPEVAHTIRTGSEGECCQRCTLLTVSTRDKQSSGQYLVTLSHTFTVASRPRWSRISTNEPATKGKAAGAIHKRGGVVEMVVNVSIPVNFSGHKAQNNVSTIQTAKILRSGADYCTTNQRRRQWGRATHCANTFGVPKLARRKDVERCQTCLRATMCAWANIEPIARERERERSGQRANANRVPSQAGPPGGEWQPVFFRGRARGLGRRPIVHATWSWPAPPPHDVRAQVVRSVAGRRGPPLPRGGPSHTCSSGFRGYERFRAPRGI